MIKSRFFIPKKLVINGGNPVAGSVDISGAKNSILGLMCASLLTNEPVILHNVPNISDVLELGRILIELGVDVRYNFRQKILYLHAAKITNNIVSQKASHIRASYYLWGSLLARFRYTKEFDSLKVYVPGGCSFGGKRPTDFHEDLIRSVLGASIEEENSDKGNYLIFTLPHKNPETVRPIYTTLRVSHGATFHWLLAVAGAQDAKMIYNASLEPEVSNLVNMLQQMGLGLSGNESTGIIYDGKNKSLLSGGNFYVIPDRIEAATYALLALGTKGEIQLNGINFEHCRPWFSQLNKMFKSGIFYSPDRTQLSFNFRNRPDFDGILMQMTPFPGAETDIQQIWTPVLGLAQTDSLITDAIWPGRDGHLKEMRKFGLNCDSEKIDIVTSQVIANKEALLVKIYPSKYHSADVEGMDLRGTAGLIITAAIADGKSTIETPSYALRGYPNLVHNLQNIGIDIQASAEGEDIELLPYYEA